MLPCYVLLDLETTGGNPALDRVIEVAAVRVENGHEVARLNSLVCPGVGIPPFIQNLTGIDNAMVQHAPRFEAIAPSLKALLDGAVLVAHNVRFDHGFLQKEFARLGLPLQVQTLCTVRLSRKLYPQAKGHGLDAIMKRHGLQTDTRHRAMGDVDMVAVWLKLARAELGAALLQTQAQALLQTSAALPPLLQTSITDIPEAPGVYIFYSKEATPLYVGKSLNMRSRILQHFQAQGLGGTLAASFNDLSRIDWHATAGDLGARLLAIHLIQTLRPVHNRPPPGSDTLCAWRLGVDTTQRPLLKLIRAEDLSPREFEFMYGLFKSKRAAYEHLRQLASTHALCPQALGLESTKGACSAHPQGLCHGVCCGQEAAPRHYLRLQLALAPLKFKVWPFAGRVGLREHNPRTGQTDIHLFDPWCHVATVHDDQELADALQTQYTQRFNLSVYQLLVSRLSAPVNAGHRGWLDFEPNRTRPA